MSWAIRTQGLGKKYRIGRQRASYETLREAIHRWLSPRRRHQTATEFWALRDVDLQIEEGTAVGLIGANGAGKSTLLKILSRITEPTQGRAELRGRVGSLLEVGTGFHPELTGRENILMSGSILGMRRHEIQARLDQIVDFSGVSEYIDTPVKRYSSGMQVRLGFAVAAHLDTEILLADEVLAVGDAAFRERCLGRLGEVAGSGRTVLLVSHNMVAIRQTCSRAVLLEQGRIRVDGPSEEAIEIYLRSATTQHMPEAALPKTPEIRVESFSTEPVVATGVPLDPRQEVAFRIDYELPERLPNLLLGVDVHSAEGLHIGRAYDRESQEIQEPREPGRYTSRFRVPGGFFRAGTYFVSLILGLHGVRWLSNGECRLAVQFESYGTGVSLPGVIGLSGTWDETGP